MVLGFRVLRFRVLRFRGSGVQGFRAEPALTRAEPRALISELELCFASDSNVEVCEQPMIM